LAQSQEQNRERRLIDVTQSEMAPASDVIELVAKITVAAVCQQVTSNATVPKKMISADSVE